MTQINLSPRSQNLNPTLHQPLHSKVSNYLNDQRRTGQYCDLIIELEDGVGDAACFAHYCVVAAQSELVGSTQFLKNSLQFSVQCPVKVTVKKFDCLKCLQTLIDFFYEDVITISTEHEQHFKELAEKLLVTELLNLFGNNSTETGNEITKTIENAKQRISNENDNEMKQANNEIEVQVGDEDIFGDKRKYFKLTNPRASCSSIKINYCIGCDFKCYRAKEMIIHMTNCEQSHLTCSLCEIGFWGWREYELHLKKHSQNMKKPFFCLECDTHFVTRAALLIHLPKHSTERLHVCKECNKSFKYKQGLTNHMIVHQSKDKRMLCDVCGFSTAHMKSLKAHKLAHAGELFPCPYPECTHKANRKENLKIHIETHNKHQEFVCEVCGNVFSQKKNLQRHALKHSAEHKGKYKCQLCSFNSHRSDKLKEHMAHVHTEKKDVQLELPEIVENSFENSADVDFNLPKHINDIKSSKKNVQEMELDNIEKLDDMLLIEDFNLPEVANTIDVM